MTGTCGGLRSRLDEAAEANGVNIGDLTVLAPANDPYRYDTPAGRQLAEWFAKQISKHVKPHADIHLRGLHYRLITKPDGTPYINDDAHWAWLCKAAQATRWLDLVPFERILDQRNDPPEIYIPEVHEDGCRYLLVGGVVALPSLESLLPTVYVSPVKPAQPYRIVLMGEKSSLAPDLRAIASMVGGEMILPTGDPSDTLIAAMINRAPDDGRRTIVLYFADFDPAGSQMLISLSRKVQALCDQRSPGLEIEVHRVALTRKQCFAFDLPSTPLKETERRGDRWQAITGREQTELDALMALQPGRLRDIAFAAIAPFFGTTLQTRAREAAQDWQNQAEEELRASEGYAPACALLEEALVAITAAAESFREASARAREMLPSLDGWMIPAPEATLTAPASEPLFTTDDDFATASGKLIAKVSREALPRLSYRQVCRLRLAETQLSAYARHHGYKPGLREQEAAA